MQPDMWGVLLEPHRRALLGLLRQRPHTVGELVEGLGIPQPSTSKHLRILREAGLVRVTTDGPRRIYALDPAPLAQLDEWLEPYRALWNDRLDALADHLDLTREER